MKKDQDRSKSTKLYFTEPLRNSRKLVLMNLNDSTVMQL